MEWMSNNTILSTLTTELEALGPFIGIAIIFYSGVLIVQGHRQIKRIAAISGAVAGYLIAPFINSLIMVFLPEIQPFVILSASVIICSLIMTSMINISIRMMAAIFIFVTFTNAIEFFGKYGIDVEGGDVFSGIASILAFFFASGIRKILPIIFSALIGAYGGPIGFYLLFQKPLLSFESTGTFTLLFVIPTFIISVYIQRKDLEKLEDLELDKEIEAELKKDPNKYEKIYC
ncbi:MAG: hypothetical protein HOF90_07045 [Euryarchaeota archaeon]|nr:hypothetical protein [Euryarchaeota archaeon]